MTEQKGVAARVHASRAVAAVMAQGRSLDDAMADWPADFTGADRGLARMLAYGCLREHRRLGAMLAPRIRKRPRPVVDALLRIGVFQLEATRIPAHAAVHATVAATRKLGQSKARGMVNAILRGHQREPVTPDDHNLAERYSYPDWLVRAIEQDWGRQAPAVLAGGNARAPMHTRVNQRQTTPQTLQAEWQEQALAASPTPFCPRGLTLQEATTSAQLPGFAEGRVSIQDGAAQLAADLLAPEDGHTVLDACAAPGNKTAHLLEQADIDLTALDIDAQRVQTLADNLERLGLGARLQTADAARPDTWWQGRPFDRILLDAPCSGTGVIRRHPDIKWLRRASDIGSAAQCQRQLLDALWPLLAPGGRLVYATCSLLRAEGVDIIADFLARNPEARHIPIEADWGQPEQYGRRLAPDAHGFDGFYYAILVRSR